MDDEEINNKILNPLEYPDPQIKVRLPPYQKPCIHIKVSTTDIKSKLQKKQARLRKKHSDQFYIRSLNIREQTLEAIENKIFKEQKVNISKQFATNVSKVKNDVVHLIRFKLQEEEFNLDEEITQLKAQFKEKYQGEYKHTVQKKLNMGIQEYEHYISELKWIKLDLVKKINRVINQFSSSKQNFNELLTTQNTQESEDVKERAKENFGYRDDKYDRINQSQQVIQQQFRKLYGNEHMNRQQIKYYMTNPRQNAKDQELYRQMLQVEKEQELKIKRENSQKQQKNQPLFQKQGTHVYKDKDSVIQKESPLKSNKSMDKSQSYSPLQKNQKPLPSLDIVKKQSILGEINEIENKSNKNQRMENIKNNPGAKSNVITAQSTVKKSQINLNQNATRFLPPQLQKKIKTNQMQKQQNQQQQSNYNESNDTGFSIVTQNQQQQKQQKTTNVQQQQYSNNDQFSIIQPVNIKNISNVPQPEFLQAEDVRQYQTQEQQKYDYKQAQSNKVAQEQYFRQFIADIEESTNNDKNNKTEKNNEVIIQDENE